MVLLEPFTFNTNPMRWGNRLLNNNDKAIDIIHRYVRVFPVTSVIDIGEEGHKSGQKLFSLLTDRQKSEHTQCIMSIALSFLFHHIYYPYRYGSRLGTVSKVQCLKKM